MLKKYTLNDKFELGYYWLWDIDVPAHKYLVQYAADNEFYFIDLGYSESNTSVSNIMKCPDQNIYLSERILP
jgi:Neuraminidase (sialidase)